MTSAVLCNVCSCVCSGNQYVSLQAWQGKDQHQRRRRGKSECWTIKQREDVEQLSADVCMACLENYLPIIQLNSSKTRQVLMQELRESNPEMSSFELLRRTVEVGAVLATCDICKADCLDKHLSITANWSDETEDLTAEICEPCVSDYLSLIVQFQIKCLISNLPTEPLI